ncbi:mevalonate kinase [Candidatus Korarchaeum cryptofilum]|uniref:Mevalonate kinase n=1 Tax=Candidatus Korarchaeum cryptofilum TaxID=498846 RepID=A0A429G6Q5_9CREN|nr:mevalonate kinase [Candidatus Korarchaeum cryptofilum]RSN69470.1 mevalonate kinase [Candidatus Korarchaeum cryptofilum]
MGANLRVRASAPSQAFLLGEHAVLYGSPALALSVDKRSHVEASPLPEGEIMIESELGVYKEGSSYNEDLVKLAKGVKELFNKYGIRSGVHLRIRSEVPASSGMASSASVAAAISKSIDALFNLGMSESELLDAVYTFERIIHGRASKTGPACAVLGGVIWVEWSDGEMRATSLGHREVPVAIACTGEPSRTKEMVERVSKLREAFPEVHEGIVRAISDLVFKGREALESGDFRTLGSLMNINQGLLYSLGVSSLAIERIIWEARMKGALGAKLSGAGGGGCVVILHEAPEEVASNLTSASISFPARVSRRGVVLEP